MTTAIQAHTQNPARAASLSPRILTVATLLADRTLANFSQGLRYGTVTTREEFFVEWKSANTSPTTPGALLDWPLAELCGKSRLLDLIRNFIIFDAGLLEYVIVHEMIHLLEPTRSQRFISLLTEHYPTWRESRAELNGLPLTAEAWRE